ISGVLLSIAVGTPHEAKLRLPVISDQLDKSGFEVSAVLPYNRRVSGPFAQPITATTRICAVYGHPIKHSASPAMQNAGIAALGLNWRYVAFDVHPDHLRDAIAGAKAMRFIGLNLTVPHKLFAVKIVDVIDEAAKPWG